jgi:hypothetical protein
VGQATVRKDRESTQALLCSQPLGHEMNRKSTTDLTRWFQFSQIEFGGWWAIGIHPLDDHGPTDAVLVVLQIAVDRPHDRPSVFEVDAQDGIEEFPVHDCLDIFLDTHVRAVLTVSRQAAGPHHSPESFFPYKETSLIGQCVGESVVLMDGMDHDVGAVQSRSFGVMVQERSAGSKHIPGVVDVKIRHAQPEGEVNSGYSITNVIDCNELTLRKDLSMIFKFFERVGSFGGVNELANLDDGLVIRGRQVADFIVARQHGRRRKVERSRGIGKRSCRRAEDARRSSTIAVPDFSRDHRIKRTSSLHFMVSAFAVEIMSRLSGAFRFTSLGFFAATDVRANLVAADNLLFGRNNFFLSISHCQNPHSVRFEIEIEG